MMTATRAQASTLAVLHASLFTTGLVTLLAGFALSAPRLLLVSGPCLALTGILIWIGSRITFTGPLGDALRLALGRTRIVTIHLRAAIWLLVGVLVTLWGMQRLRHPGHGEPLWRQPIADLRPAPRGSES